MSMNEVMHVAVGVICDEQGNILITRRSLHVHQGGLWEFPGGKVEAGETIAEALQRELLEEVGIQVITAVPLIKIRHDYGDRRVLLDVWRVTQFAGQACACEGQGLVWVTARRLDEFAFPAANLSIIKAVQLPDCYAILEGLSIADVLCNCRQILSGGVRLIQLRVKSLSAEDVPQALALVSQLCREQQAMLLVNSDLAISPELVDGLHLSSRALLAADVRPSVTGWLAASCHNLLELQCAEKLGVDFAVLAPVLPTKTHPNIEPIGWQGFTALLEQVNIPVYALGGLQLADLPRTFQAGGQGLAGISAFLQ